MTWWYTNKVIPLVLVPPKLWGKQVVDDRTVNCTKAGTEVATASDVFVGVLDLMRLQFLIRVGK